MTERQEEGGQERSWLLSDQVAIDHDTKIEESSVRL